MLSLFEKSRLRLEVVRTLYQLMFDEPARGHNFVHHFGNPCAAGKTAKEGLRKSKAVPHAFMHARGGRQSQKVTKKQSDGEDTNGHCTREIVLGKSPWKEPRGTRLKEVL